MFFSSFLLSLLLPFSNSTKLWFRFLQNILSWKLRSSSKLGSGCVIVKIWVGFDKIYEFFTKSEISRGFHEILENFIRFREILEKPKGFTMPKFRETFEFFQIFMKPLGFSNISWNLWFFSKFRETFEFFQNFAKPSKIFQNFVKPSGNF